MKNLPYSLEAERAVLGAMILSKDALLNSVVRLTVDDFYVEDHKLIFDTIRAVYNKNMKVDAVTVIEQLALNNTLNQLSNKEETVYDLIMNVVSASNVEEYIRIIQDKTTLRKLVALAENVSTKWKKEEISDISEYVAKVESDTLAITRSRNVGSFKTTKEVIEVLKEQLFANGKANGNLTGVTSGFTDIDNITHGFQKGDLIILAARPSMGKTALALNFLVNAAIKQNVTTAMFSVEMPAEQLMQRMISSQSGVNGDKLRSLDLSNINTSNATSMFRMFADCTAITSLNISKLNTSKVKDMGAMFQGCEKLEKIDVSSFDTSSVDGSGYSMQNMFYKCYALKKIDLISFNTSSVTNMKQMFDACKSLTTIYVSELWSTSALTSPSTSIFYGNTSLVGGAGTTFNSSYVDATYAKIDGGTDNPGYFTDITDKTE